MSTAAFGGQPLWLWAYAGYGRRAGRRVPGMFLYVLIGISQLPEKLEFVEMPERNTFPRGEGAPVRKLGRKRNGDMFHICMHFVKKVYWESLYRLN